MRTISCVLLGDGYVGKNCLLESYATSRFNAAREPTTFSRYSVTCCVGSSSEHFRLSLLSVSGQHDFGRLRRLLVFPEADVFLVCFSVVAPDSFQNVRTQWVAELEDYCAGVPFVLVGTQTDRRQELMALKKLTKSGLKPVTRRQGERMARRLGAYGYVECSAFTQSGLREVFTEAILAALGVRVYQGGKQSCGVL